MSLIKREGRDSYNNVVNHLTVFSMRKARFFSSSRQASFVQSILMAWSMLSLAEVYSSWMNWVTARLQKASSQPGSRRIAFSQFIAAFSGIPRLKYASARFLQKQCLRRYFRHFSSTTIDSEQRPSLLRAAARLLWRCRVTSNSSALSSSLSRMLSHTSRHSFAFSVSRYRQERYSAAERLLGEYFSAAFRSSIALSLSDFSASQKSSSEFFSFISRIIRLLSYCSSFVGLKLGISFSVSSFSSSFTIESTGSLLSTGLRAMPKPTVLCLSILRLFLKIGDWISSKYFWPLLGRGTLTILLVTTSCSCSVLGTEGGAGMRLLRSSATLKPPLLRMASKMFCSDALLEASDLFSYEQALSPGVETVFSMLVQSFQSQWFRSSLTDCFPARDGSVCFASFSRFSFSLSFEENTFSRMYFFLSSIASFSFSP